MGKILAATESNIGESGNQKAILFGSFRLDLRAGQLLNGSQPVSLRPKTFAVLRHLAERPGALVSKLELLNAVWADTAVSENTLTQSIGELRRALKDDSARPRFIETVHHRGFRFVAAARTDDAEPVLAAPVATPIEAREPGAGSFVGRRAELQQLDELLARAQGGSRQVLFVSGEAGIGKTALLQTFLAGTAASRALVAHGQAVEQLGAHEPYLPVLDALGRLARLTDPQPLVARLRRVAPTWLAQLPWLLEPVDAAALRQSLIDVRPQRMLRELAVFLEELTATATVILVLEDLHWSDPSTIELLLMLAQRSEPARLLVIGTYRPAEASVQDHPLVGAQQTLRLRHCCSQLSLEYLTRADVAAYLEQRFPQAELPKALAGLIHEHTDGSPLFMVAIVEQLINRGWLAVTDGRWSLAAPLETLHLEVPDDLREMIRLQFHRMSPVDASLLEAAAVSGASFTAAEIAQAVDAELSVGEGACERMVRTYRFLRIADDPTAAATARSYAFIHALYQRVLYEEIPAGRRRRLHLRIGDALERAHTDGRPPNAFRLAFHFERGGDAGRAIDYLAAAAASALQRFAPREAVECLTTAVKLVEHLPEARHRHQREIELRVPLTAALNLVHGYASRQVRESCERARTLSEQSGSLPELYEALYALWYSQAVRGEQDASGTALRLVEVAAQLDTAAHRLRCAAACGHTALYRGNYREAADTLSSAIAAWESAAGVASDSAYGADPLVAAHAHLAWTLWLLGYPDQARRTCTKALALAQTALPFTRAAADIHAALVELFRGDGGETLEHADRGLALATRLGFPMWQDVASAFRGWALLQGGDPATGEAELRAAIDRIEANGMRLTRPLLLALLAEAELHRGSPAEALATVHQGLQLTETCLDRFYEPELWRLKGEILLAIPARRRPQTKEAAECFENALTMARERSARSLELRTATSLARLERAAGKRGSAQQQLAAVYGWFTEGFDTPDLLAARALLA